MIDSHLHTWTLGPHQPRWLRDEFQRSFELEEARALLDHAEIEQAILVQADDTEEDTARLLQLQHENDWVVGVVGWLPIENPVAVASALDQGTTLVGVRQLIHDDPRSGILALPPVIDSARLLADAGLTLDIPNAWPRDLAAVAALADAVPTLTVIVDHLGKPPTEGDRSEWERVLRTVARRDNVVAKLSGLGTVHDIRPLVDVALDAFGAERLMYGGDWPMTQPLGGYAPVFAAMRAVIETLSPSERWAIWSGTATRTYRL